jgi:predicted acylesterase/phospholipase RssA
MTKQMARPDPDPELGLCLSGGGGRGLLHVGLLLALEDLGIRPGVVAGASSGALLGALYASGKPAEEIRSNLEGFKWTEIIAPSLLRRRGILSTIRLQAFYRRHLGAINIEDLPIRMKIAATNLMNGKVVGFTSGSLTKCLAASSAIPGIFEPVRVNGGVYYDSAGIYNLPLELFAGEGVKRIIAGNTIGQYGLMTEVKTVQDTLNQAYLIRTMHLTALKTGPMGWQGKNDEELIFIDYRTGGANPGNISDCKGLVEDTRKLSLDILNREF